MSYKFDSLITILNKLDNGEHATVQSLIDDLEQIRRSIIRHSRFAKANTNRFNFV